MSALYAVLTQVSPIRVWQKDFVRFTTELRHTDFGKRLSIILYVHGGIHEKIFSGNRLLVRHLFSCFEQPRAFNCYELRFLLRKENRTQYRSFKKLL